MAAIVHGSCLDFDPRDVPTGSVMIGDPPYSDHVHEKMQSSCAYASRARRRPAGFDALTPDVRRHIAAIGSRCRWSVVFCDFEGVGAWRDAFNEIKGYRYIRCIPWIRWSMPQLSGDRPPSGAEAIVIAAPDGALRWNGPGNLTHFAELCERGKDKHTTAKPLDLMLRLVAYFSDPGELVIDPTCGRGTTIKAADLLGRDGLGFETQAEEVEKGLVRLENELDERDAERWRRWRAFEIREAEDMARIREATNTIRAKRGLAPK